MRTLHALLLATGALASCASAQVCTTAPTGLVAWWDADTLFPDRYGVLSNALDVQHPLRGIPARGPSAIATIPGVIGNGFDLSGAPLRVDDDDRFDPVGSFSVEMWFQGGSQAPQPYFMLVDKALDQFGGVGLTGWSMWGIPTGNIGFRLGHGLTVTEAWSGPGYLDNQPHHIVGTYDLAQAQDNVRLYIDGNLVAMASTPLSSSVVANNNVIQFGVYTSNGMLDEVRYYDRALTPTEVGNMRRAVEVCRTRFPARRLDTPANRITNPNPTVELHFGKAIAVDGNRMAVISAVSGDLRIYERSGNSWASVAQVPNPYPLEHSNVALSGDVLAVGGGSWRAFVYRRSGTSWNLERLFGPVGFGYGKEVAIDSHPTLGDTLLIGDAYNDRFEVWRATGGGPWTLEQLITNPVTSPNQPSAFGNALAIRGDLILCGSHLADLDGTDSGAVYVYRRTGTTWTLADTITPIRLGAPPWNLADHTDRQLGESLTLDGTRAVLVAPGPGPANQQDRGAAYVVDLSGSTMVVEGELLPAERVVGFGSPAWDPVWYGSSINPTALLGDLAVVGAHSDSEARVGWGSNPPPGAAHVYAREGGTWKLIGKCMPLDPLSSGAGSSVAIAGDQVLLGTPSYGVFVFDGFGGFNAGAYSVVYGTGCGNLALAMNGRPALGETISFETQNISPAAVFSAMVMSFGTSGPIELSSLGMPHCEQNLDLLGSWTYWLFGAPTATVTVTVPNLPALVGSKLYAQSVSFLPGANPLGVVASNAVEFGVGEY